ncbi:MAG: hypothetical protein JW913_10735 [Chitinispirillaceae bacterium]|nr:hypothetical protein [Chitinispirillaceae bacterium]
MSIHDLYIPGRTAVMTGLLCFRIFATGSVPAGAAVISKASNASTAGVLVVKVNDTPTGNAAPKRGDTAAATPAAKSADTLVVTARLTEIPGKFVVNDLYDYVYVMKYRVLSVERGVYGGKEILVGHYNPLIARKLIKDKMDALVDGTVERFTVGAKHRLVLIESIERVWNGEVEDEYFDTDLAKFYALKADMVH